MNDITLNEMDLRMLAGEEGRARQMAMEMTVKSARAVGVTELVDVSFAHVNSCFYSGQVGLDFAEFLLAHGGKVKIPSQSNVGLVDLMHPELRPEKQYSEEVRGARRQMEIYEALGCESIWTCAPYQRENRPTIGQHIVGSESNAVSFYNSVLGARTNKYGDFLDICGALTGRVPKAGLHCEENRRGQIVFHLDHIDPALLQEDVFYHVLGILFGKYAGTSIPVVTGIPKSVNEDQLKAVAAAGAASGGVALFHMVGVTPEAPDLESALQGQRPDHEMDVTASMLKEGLDMLSRGGQGHERLGAVCLGTPHFSVTEFEALVHLLEGRRISDQLRCFISTSRFVLDIVKEEGWYEMIEAAGITLVVDTCTYYSPKVAGLTGKVMTNSGKWAYYAPGILDLDVIFGSLAECVESAIAGKVVRNEVLWQNVSWGGGLK